MENLTNHFFEKINEEMKNEHSPLEDKIHNWLCDQINDIELMQAVVIEGKSIQSAVHYFFDKLAKETVKIGNNVSYAACSDDEGYAIVREYFMSDLKEVKESKLYSVQSSSDKVREVTKEVVKEIKVSVDKKAKQSIEAILKLEMSDADKLRLIGSISEPEEVKKDEDDGELLSLFDL